MKTKKGSNSSKYNKNNKKCFILFILSIGLFLFIIFMISLDDIKSSFMVDKPIEFKGERTPTGSDNLITGFVTINTVFTVYIDPTYNGANGVEDGSINRPFNSWSDFTIQNGGAYLQKRGTVANINSITYRSNNIIGAYGEGPRPILNSTTTGYAITGDNQENVLIRDLEIINTPYPNGTRRGIAIRFLHNFKNMYVDNCVIHGGGQAISASYGGSAYYPYNLTITNNEMYDLSTDAVYAQGISGFLNFSNNYIHDINMAWFEVGQTESQSPGDGLQLISHQYGQVEIFASNNIIDRTNTANKFCIILVGNYTGILENNTCYVNSYLTVQTRVSGFYLSPTENQLIFRNNKCFNCSYGIYNYVRNLTMHNNLFVNSNIAISTMGSSSVYGRVYMYNNLFYNSDFRDVSAWNSNVTLYNNIFYSDSPDHTEFNGVVNFVASDYNLFNTAFNTGMDVNSIQANPLFVNPANHDFSLQSSSPAIDAGINVGLNRDIVGTFVPQGSAPDIGAYEYISGAPATGSLSVVAGVGGTASGSASNFSVPASINVVGVASSDYVFNSWTKTSGDCVVQNVLSSSTTVNVNSGVCVVQANFDVVVNTGNLSVIAGVGGSASGSASNFLVPVLRSINSTANSGYVFNSWTKISGDCAISDFSSANTVVMVSSGVCVVQANFDVVVNTGNLSVVAGVGGSASGSASGFVVPATRSIVASAQSGYSFGSWTKISGDCVVQNVLSSSTTVNVNSGVCVVQANFDVVVNTGNLSVVAGVGGSASGSASGFVVPATRSIVASAQSGYSFGSWTKTSGDCTISNSASSSTSVVVSGGVCVVQANFDEVGGNILNGAICSSDSDCISGNCDADFYDVMRCHATATACIVNSQGQEISSGERKCLDNYTYKLCTDAIWSSVITVNPGFICVVNNPDYLYYVPISVDVTPPVTSISGTYVKRAFNRYFYTVNFIASDDVEVASTHYKIGNDAWKIGNTYTSKYNKPVMILYYSVDTSGNVESQKSVTVTKQGDAIIFI